MRLRWSAAALFDIKRLQQFLVAKDPAAARKARDDIRAAPRRLSASPRIGPRLETISDTKVRRIKAGRYEIQYALDDELIVVVRVFHEREDRPR